MYYTNSIIIFMYMNYIISHFLAAITFLSIPLTTPTATVCFISLTANLPNGGYSAKTSRDKGLVGTILTKQASPVLTNLGSSSSSFPVRLSILDLIS